MVVYVEQQACKKLLLRARAAVDGPRRFMAKTACTFTASFTFAVLNTALRGTNGRATTASFVLTAATASAAAATATTAKATDKRGSFGHWRGKGTTATATTQTPGAAMEAPGR